MSKVSQFHSKEDILEQASLWVSKIDRGLTSSEQLALAVWVEISPSHHQALMKMASLWDDLTVLEELKCLFPLSKSKKIQPQPKSTWRSWGMAASVMFMATLLANTFFEFKAFNLLNNEAISYAQTYKTQLGQQQSFSLPDGSTLQLNTNSEVKVSFTEHKRFLVLVKGEANFDVEKDAARPFVVNVADKSFTALGTVFNIQKNSAQVIELLVTEGKVLINEVTETKPDAIEMHPNEPMNAVNGLLVTSGEKALIENSRPKPVIKINSEQVGRDLAWRSGMLIFDDETLENALNEVSRYNDTDFDIASPELAKLKISGYFKAGDIEGLLLSLKYDFDVDVQRSGSINKTITLSKPIQG